MKPSDFFYYGKGLAPQKDASSLVVFYYPIIGADAFALYHYFLSFWDGGSSQTQVAQVLNHLQFGVDRFNQALELLQVVRLVEVFIADSITLYLRSPLEGAEFLQDHLLRPLLKNKIGEVALKELEPAKPQGQKQVANEGKFFKGLLAGEQREVVKATFNQFDPVTFQKRLEKGSLSYANRDTDVLALELLAREYHLNWNQLYQLAEETAVQGKVATNRMEAKLKQKPVVASFSQGESFYLKESKSQSALEFLGQLKDTRGSSVTDQERALILSLQKQGFLDEVISILLLLAYNRDNSLQINERYVLRVAEDFQKQGITSAEEAIVRIQQRIKETSPSRKQTSSGNRKKGSSPSSPSNVPNWSQKNYVDQTTPEEMRAREEERKRMFQQMKGEGN
ncbi:hypothetical protein E5983_02305 [Streptococcus danieliae]|uniref:DNA helicase n=1 Tax=Streptococcus danieliae TaxID=747656 RepID=A0A7X3G7C5_9STRE|nr:hypothetical protein [Streptococcus danieliae]